MNTRSLLGRRALRDDHLEDYPVWATDQLVDGRDSYSLRILASLTPPFDREEVDRLFRKTAEELHVRLPSASGAIRDYALELFEDFESGSLSPERLIQEMAQISYIESNDPLYVVWIRLEDEQLVLGSDGAGWAYPGLKRETLDNAVRREIAIFRSMSAITFPGDFLRKGYCRQCGQFDEPGYRPKNPMSDLIARLFGRIRPVAYPYCLHCGGDNFLPMYSPEGRERLAAEHRKGESSLKMN